MFTHIGNSSTEIDLHWSVLFSCQDQYEHGFKPAMKLEAVNPLSPENIHVATVARVKGQYIWLSLEGEMLLSKNVFNSLMSSLWNAPELISTEM